MLTMKGSNLFFLCRNISFLVICKSEDTLGNETTTLVLKVARW